MCCNVLTSQSSDEKLKRAFQRDHLRIAVFSIHSSPLGKLGAQNTGGMSVYIMELFGELGKAGHRVDVYTLAENGQGHTTIMLSNNVRLIHLTLGNRGPLPKDSLYEHLPEVCHIIESYRLRHDIQYDLIHSHYWLSGKVGMWAQRQWNIPHLLMFHSTGFMKRIRCAEEYESALRLINEKKLARECTRLLVPTEEEKECIVKFYGTPRENIGLVPCGVNLDLFRPLPRTVARMSLGLRQDEEILLYVGRLAPIKGLNQLIAAIAHMNRCSKVRLVVVGGDTSQVTTFRELRRFARALGISSLVTFSGLVEQQILPLYYSAADLLIVPSHYESFGLVALEALACGTPVIATPVGAIKEIINEGETGLVVEKASPSSLAEAAKRFLPSSGRSAVSRESLRTSVLRHCWSRVGHALMKEYAKVFSNVVCERV